MARDLPESPQRLDVSTVRDASSYAKMGAMAYEPLTEREEEIIECVAAGMTSTQIAEMLCVEERTVKWHLGNIYSKLGALNRANAVFLWHTDRISQARQREAERIQKRIEALTAATI